MVVQYILKTFVKLNVQGGVIKTHVVKAAGSAISTAIIAKTFVFPPLDPCSMKALLVLRCVNVNTWQFHANLAKSSVVV